MTCLEEIFVFYKSCTLWNRRAPYSPHNSTACGSGDRRMRGWWTFAPCRNKRNEVAVVQFHHFVRSQFPQCSP